MQTLGLSESTPRTQPRWKNLFWPTIRNESDYDYITEQGFWVCLIIALDTELIGLFQAHYFLYLIDALYFFLAGVGIRQRSVFASISVLVVYFVGFVLASQAAFIATGVLNGGGLLRTVFTALLIANIRGIWLSAKWKKSGNSAETPIRLRQTLGDRLSDQLPSFLWPKTRHIFYVYSVVQVGVMTLYLLVRLFVHTTR